MDGEVNPTEQFFRVEYPNVWQQMDEALKGDPEHYRQYADKITRMKPVQVDCVTRQCLDRFVETGRLTLDDFCGAIDNNYGKPYLRELPRE